MAVGLRRFLQLKHDARIPEFSKSFRLSVSRCYCEKPQVEEVSEEFDVLEIYPRQKDPPRKLRDIRVDPPPRVKLMTPEMDWTNIWPGPKTYHPAAVPLPVRQGINKHGPPVARFANTELMKIPNFLHLTPPAIQKHCEALKKFCTEWPEELKDEETVKKLFPIKVITSDHCHSSCSIRDPDTRAVTLKFKLSSLELDVHAKDKFLRLVGERYDPKTDYVTITTDSCPIKKQNYDYAHYLLTAVYFESWKKEDWESLKGDEDMEYYIFSERQSFRNVKKVFDYNGKELPPLENYKAAVEDWMNNGDSDSAVSNYKEAVRNLLQLPSFDAEC